MRRRCFPHEENNRADAPAPWLSLWESWHGVAVTERVPGSNLRTFPIFATAHALSGSPLARQLSHRESQGRLRRRIQYAQWRTYSQNYQQTVCCILCLCTGVYHVTLDNAIRPYADVPHCTWCVFFGWLKLINYSIDCVHCQSVWFMGNFIACCFIFFLTGQTHLVTIEL